MGLDIHSVYISDAMTAKIGSKHGLTQDEILDACWHRIREGWVYDDRRGWRLFLEGYNEHHRVVQVVLYPTAQDGHWNLGTAQYG